MANFLAAGIETTAYCLAYTILLLARHPEVILRSIDTNATLVCTNARSPCYWSRQVQHKLKQEVRKVLGQRTNVTAEDYKNLTYVVNVMQVRSAGSAAGSSHWWCVYQ
jgi:cytochrome P450